MIRTSETTGKLNGAFAKAQAKFEAAIKGNVNPAFRSKYADVSSIIDATLSHLNSEGISIRQHPSFEFKGEGDSREAFVTVTTRLTFEDEWEESDLSLPAVQRDRFDAQSCGSSLTYACRYALQGVLVVRREDDDGNQATGRGSSEDAQRLGKEKIAKLKEKTSPEPSNSQASLFYALQPSGLYAVQGDKDLMKRLWPQFKNYWQQHAEAFMLSDDQLNTLQFQCTEGNIPLKQLQGPKA